MMAIALYHVASVAISLRNPSNKFVSKMGYAMLGKNRLDVDVGARRFDGDCWIR